MTPLQKHVKENGVDSLSALGIKVCEHPTLPLVGFKYNQITSPKTDEVVRWSRGTVLEKDTWALVAQPFRRFYNFGEGCAEDMQNFDWSNCSITSKEDGSLCILYYYRGEWHVNTSGSFALLQYDQLKSETWRDLFWRTFDAIGGKKNQLMESLTYIFEIVRQYSPTLYLLGVFFGSNEWHWDEVEKQSKSINIPMPEQHTFKSIVQVEDYLTERAKTDATFEGVVLRDHNGIRFKVKSASYVALHHLKGGISRTSRLIELALSNEGDEVLTYFPEIRAEFDAVRERLKTEFETLNTIWEKHKTIQDQKTFALAVKDKKYSSVLFTARKTGKPLDELWRGSSELIINRWTA
jgi:hypothetical protein